MQPRSHEDNWIGYADEHLEHPYPEYPMDQTTVGIPVGNTRHTHSISTTECQKLIDNLATLAARDPGQRGFSTVAATGQLQPAAEALLAGSRIIITTGFCIRAAMIGENDGPPGALALANALRQLGKAVAFVTDRFSWSLLEAGAELYGGAFPITELSQTQTTADTQIAELLDAFQPTQVVAIERPGSAIDGHRYSMRGQILDDLVPAADRLLTPESPRHFSTIAIGDGGNELGLGSLRESHMQHVKHGEIIFCATPADFVIPAGISNWGAYALVGALAALSGQPLMPPPEQERRVLERLLAAGAVDGCTGRAECSVDGIAWEDYAATLREMHRIVCNN